MLCFFRYLVYFFLQGLLVLCNSSLSIADESADALFVRRIAPLLQSKCLACHGNDPSTLVGSLDLRTLDSSLVGGDHGEPVIVIENPAQSPLILAINRNQESWSAMPPKEAEKLSQEQIGWVEKWIQGGAPWPNENRFQEILQANSDRWASEDGSVVPTSGGQSAEWTERRYKADGRWAYQPVKKPLMDKSESAAIDALIAMRMPNRCHAQLG